MLLLRLSCVASRKQHPRVPPVRCRPLWPLRAADSAAHRGERPPLRGERGASVSRPGNDVISSNAAPANDAICRGCIAGYQELLCCSHERGQVGGPLPCRGDESGAVILTTWSGGYPGKGGSGHPSSFPQPFCFSRTQCLPPFKRGGCQARAAPGVPPAAWRREWAKH